MLSVEGLLSQDKLKRRLRSGMRSWLREELGDMYAGRPRSWPWLGWEGRFVAGRVGRRSLGHELQLDAIGRGTANDGGVESDLLVCSAKRACPAEVQEALLCAAVRISRSSRSRTFASSAAYRKGEYPSSTRLCSGKVCACRAQ